MSALTTFTALSWLAMPARATQRTWTGAVSGYWGDPSNWSPSGVPQNGDELDFTQASPNLSTTNDLTNLSVSELFFNNNYSYQLSGNSLTVNDILVDSGGSSQIVIYNALNFANGASVRVTPFYAVASDNEVFVYLFGTITIESGELTLVAYGDHDPILGTVKGHLYISGQLAGAGSITAEAYDFAGAKGTIEFDTVAGNPIFTGTLWLESPGDASDAPIIFNQPSGVTVAKTVGVHPYFAIYANAHGSAATLQLNQQDQTGTTLDIESGGQLILSGSSAAFDSIVMRNYSGDTNSSVLDTGSTVPSLNGSIAVRCDNNSVTPTIKGQLNLNGDLAVDVHGTATIGLDIPAAIEGGGFKKVGTSTLILSGTNTFTDVAEVSQGILDVRNSSALGAVPGNPVTLFGGSLTLHNSISGKTLWASGQSVAGDMPGSLLTAVGLNPISWDGPIVLNTNLVVVGGDVNLDGVISGAGGLFADNSGTIELGGPDRNTFTGTLLARGPLLELNKPYGVSAYSGPLIVGGGFQSQVEVRWLQSLQDRTTDLTLYANGLVNLSNSFEDFDTITFNGGTIEAGSLGGFAIYQPLIVNANSATAVINGYLNLPSGSDRDFVVADGAANPDLIVNAVIYGGPTHFVKQGAGSMELAGANTYSAVTLLEGGSLVADNSSALGSAGCVIANGTTLQLNNVGTMPNNFEVVGSGVVDLLGPRGAINATVGNNTLTGSILLDAATTLGAAPSASLTLDGAISGTGPLVNSSAGTLTLGGSSPNTYTGDTTNQSGLLYLAKSGGAVAIPGNLVLGPAPANAAASAIFESPNSIGGNTVTVNANSVLNLSGKDQTLSQLNLNDGGSVLTGSGQLAFTSGATVNVGSLHTGLNGGSHVSSSIQGNIGMQPNASGVLFNVNAYSHVPPNDSRPELDVPANIAINGFENPNQPQTGISKTGGGRLRLGGNDSFAGTAGLFSGTLQVDGTLAGGAVANGGILDGAGTVGNVFMNNSSATVSPGDGGPGILTCGNFDNGGGSGVLQVALNGTTAGSGYSQLAVNGTVNLNGITLNATLNFVAATNDQFVIIRNHGGVPVTGTMNGLPEGATVDLGNDAFHINYLASAGYNVVLTDIGTLVVPELSIEHAGTSLVRLLWATNSLNFTLQSATNLDTTNWSSVSMLPVVIGTNNVVTNAADGAKEFYRLINP